MAGLILGKIEIFVKAKTQWPSSLLMMPRKLKFYPFTALRFNGNDKEKLLPKGLFKRVTLRSIFKNIPTHIK